VVRAQEKHRLLVGWQLGRAAAERGTTSGRGKGKGGGLRPKDKMEAGLARLKTNRNRGGEKKLNEREE